MDLGLKDAHVVIVGASRGIGRAAARQFAADGAKVALIARNLFGTEDEAGAAAIARYAAATRAALAGQETLSLADGTAPAWPPIAA